eukprot:TRINITY_DN780_c0_g2_i2.p2 TRINITY_DN780_c0_g2~~TRINITY_DN780_c0_g2_i2.p2  ORF type:complete len:269 (-),score=-10.03 TRINITY_DN780_c0_g2_i2:644-1450(-)
MQIQSKPSYLDPSYAETSLSRHKILATQSMLKIYTSLSRYSLHILSHNTQIFTQAPVEIVKFDCSTYYLNFIAFLQYFEPFLKRYHLLASFFQCNSIVNCDSIFWGHGQSGHSGSGHQNLASQSYIFYLGEKIVWNSWICISFYIWNYIYFEYLELYLVLGVNCFIFFTICYEFLLHLFRQKFSKMKVLNIFIFFAFCVHLVEPTTSFVSFCFVLFQRDIQRVLQVDSYVWDTISEIEQHYQSKPSTVDSTVECFQSKEPLNQLEICG